MGLVAAFDNRSLRTKIGAAALTATVGGVIVGILAISNVNRLNADSAAAQHRSTAIGAAITRFGLNLEGFVGNINGVTAYPALADSIGKLRDADKAAVGVALTDLGAALPGDATVTKTQTDRAAFLTLLSIDHSKSTTAQLTQALANYTTQHDALIADAEALAEHRHLDWAGHLPSLERPDLLIPILLEFLAQGFPAQGFPAQGFPARGDAAGGSPRSAGARGA